MSCRRNISLKASLVFQPDKKHQLPDGSFVLMIKRVNYELVPSKDTVVLFGLITLVISDEAQSAPPPKRIRTKKKK